MVEEDKKLTTKAQGKKTQRRFKKVGVVNPNRPTLLFVLHDFFVSYFFVSLCLCG